LRREENHRTRRKTLGARVITNSKLNASMTQGWGIKPGTHWWEANALPTVPRLLPNGYLCSIMITSALKNSQFSEA